MHQITYAEFIKYKVALKALNIKNREVKEISIFSSTVPEYIGKRVVEEFQKVLIDLKKMHKGKPQKKGKNRTDSSLHLHYQSVLKDRDRYTSSTLSKEEVDNLVKSLSNHLDGYSHDYSEVILEELLTEAFGTSWRIQRRFLEALKTVFLELDQTSTYKNCPTLKALQEIRSTFALDEIDTDLIYFNYLIEDDSELDDYYRYGSKRPESIHRFINEVSQIFGHDKKVIREKLSRSSRLIKSKIIEIHRSNISVSDYIAKFLNNPKENSLLEHFVSETELVSGLNIDDFQIEKDSIGIIRNLLCDAKRPILFHGPPGCGKTEFAKVLTNEFGMESYIMSQKDEDGEESLRFRKIALAALKVRNTLSKNAVVVDEADTLLNTRNYWSYFNKSDDSKAWLNDYLDECSFPMIWIVNDISQIDESTLRRFSYTLKFRRHGAKERLRFIKRNLEVFNIKFKLDENKLKRIAQKYELNVGDIAKAIEDLAHSSDKFNESDFLDRFENILYNKSKTYDKAINTNKTLENYDVNALNINGDPKKIIDSLEQFYASNSFVKNYNLLFHGVPGTGKTEFAQYLSETLNKEIIIKKGSDLLNPYVGMTERFIAEAFEEAEAKDAILFIDEADTFFNGREMASRGWERSQTNEFLNGMERFKGVLICATNFSDNFDVAAMRRFSLKVNFDYLSEDGNVLMAKRWFGQMLGLKMNEKYFSELRELKNLTPGDFKAVSYKYAFNKDIDPDVLIVELRNEVLYKKIKRGISL